MRKRPHDRSRRSFFRTLGGIRRPGRLLGSVVWIARAGSCGQREGQSEVGHPDLQLRRAEPPRPVGSQARRPRHRPRPVPADRHQRSRHPASASCCRNWPERTDKLAHRPHRCITSTAAQLGDVLVDRRPALPHRQHAHQPSRDRLSQLRHARRLAGPARRLQRPRAALRHHARAALRQHACTSRRGSSAAAWASRYDPFVLNSRPERRRFPRRATCGCTTS